jgi:pimeloyl-ACP methyl ester carboxylesterase
MLTAERDGVKLAVRTTGLPPDRRKALLIHGLNTNMAFWHPLLVRRLGERRSLIMYDQRGHGASDLPPRGYTSDELARDAISVLDVCGVHQADVVAHSFGATVALQLVVLFPERVKSLTILDGRTRLLQPELRLRDWCEFDRWRRHFERAGIALDPNLELDFELPLHLDGEAWKLAREGLSADGFFVASGGKRALDKYRRLLTETTAPRDFRSTTGMCLESLRQIAQPVAAIYGSISPYLPTAHALMHEIAQCRLTTMQGGGHNFPFLNPAETSEAILSFWNSCRPQGAAR